MIRVGILGCSDIARRKFIPALLQSSQAILAAVASRQRSRAASFIPPNTDVKQMTYQELVCSPTLDVVYISLPNHLHEEWSIKALEHGKHVICEKPLALSAASVNRRLEAAYRSGVLLYENLMYLQHPQHKAVKEIIDSGYIGKVLSLRSEFAFPGPASGNFRLNPDVGGGAYHDMNRYPLSAALYFLEGKRHRFFQGSMEIHGGLTLSLQADSFTEAGETFSFLTAFGKPYRSYYMISGERGFVKVERAFTTPANMENRISVMSDSADESFIVPPADHFLNTINHVCELIRSGQWHGKHQQAKNLAGMADMYFDNCTVR
jgi:NDP-hexose-3-ketoreductase